MEDVSSDLSATTMENDFIPDPHKLEGTGITPGMIADALQTYTSGMQASMVQLGGISYPIIVQMDPTGLSGAQSLLDLPVVSPTLQSTMHVGQLGSFVLSRAPLRLDRTDRRYSTDLDLDLAPGAPPPLFFQRQVTAAMTAQGILGRGVTFGAEKRFGPVDLAAQLAGQAPFAFLLALFLVYLVMGAQFNSWRYPLYLLLPVPLALAGALWLLWGLGGGLDIFGLLGMLMLIGLSAKNAILYLDFVVERLKQMPFLDALIESARLRFRPYHHDHSDGACHKLSPHIRERPGRGVRSEAGNRHAGGNHLLDNSHVLCCALGVFSLRAEEAPPGSEGPGEIESLTREASLFSLRRVRPRARVEVLGEEIPNAERPFDRDDADVPQPEAACLGQRCDDVIRDFSIGGRKGRRCALQARGIECGNQVGHPLCQRVIGSPVALAELLLPRLPALLLRRQLASGVSPNRASTSLTTEPWSPCSLTTACAREYGGDHEERNSRTHGERAPVRTVGSNGRGHVVVITFGIVPGDDDGAFRPVAASSDGVDRFCNQRLADLCIGIRRMIVVAQEALLDRGVWINRLHPEDVPVSALYVAAILAAVPAVGRMFTFALETGTDPRPALARLRDGAIIEGSVIGVGAPLAQAVGAAVAGLRSFPALSGPGIAVPSTQGALWAFVGGGDATTVFDRSERLVERLGEGFRVEEEVATFLPRREGPVRIRRRNGQSRGQRRRVRGNRQGSRARARRRSFVAQRYVHDLEHFAA